MKFFVLARNAENKKVLNLRKKYLTGEPKGVIIDVSKEREEIKNGRKQML